MYEFSGYEAFTLLPTTEVMHGRTVYQGYNNVTCEPMRRFLYHYYNVNRFYEWNIDDDTDVSNDSASGGRLGYIDPYFTDACVKEAVAVIYDNGHRRSSKIRSIETSKCLPTTMTSIGLGIDASGKCLMKVTGGLVDFTFLPTTEKRDGFPVFQGYDNTTCEPLNRYLHYGKGAWNYDDDLDIAEAWDRLGRLDPQFEVCPGRTDTYGENGNHLGTFESIPSSRCFLPVKADAEQLDASGKCLMKVTGGLVDFTFLPTTEKRDGFPVFQGYDNTTCEPLNRYLHYGKGAWNYDDDLDIAETWDRLGRLDPQFEVCPGRTDTYTENGNHLGTFESIPSSRCFLPVEAEAYTQHVVKLDEDGSPVADDAAGF
eukprot:Lankesteria_metandrocarpae@DN5457_c0_g3_i2.p1